MQTTGHNNSVAKQIVAKPLEHATLVYACVMVRLESYAIHRLTGTA